MERTKSVDEVERLAVRGAIEYLDMYEIRLNYEVDLPAGAGMGTSSSSAAGMLNAFML